VAARIANRSPSSWARRAAPPHAGRWIARDRVAASGRGARSGDRTGRAAGPCRERRRDVALRELNNHRRQMGYLATSRTSCATSSPATNSSVPAARDRRAAPPDVRAGVPRSGEAQRAFNFERGLARDFLKGELWNDLHDGLLAGERLQTALRRMEAGVPGRQPARIRAHKHISMPHMFPLQLLELKLTGRCEIELPEWLFDLDYPGQYMRRSRTSAQHSVRGGPFVGVHCRLDLAVQPDPDRPRVNGPVRDLCGTPRVYMMTRVCRTCGRAHPAWSVRWMGRCAERLPGPAGRPARDPALRGDEAIATSTDRTTPSVRGELPGRALPPVRVLGAVGRYRISAGPRTLLRSRLGDRF